jgi:hypothetical protein
LVRNLPRVAIISPSPSAVVRRAPVSVLVTVTLASSVTNITLWMTNLNDGSFTNVSQPYSSRKSIDGWTALVDPSPGANRLTVWTLDANGYQSPTVSREFFFAGPGSFTLLTNLNGVATGTITGAQTGSKLNIGEIYALAAHPGAKSIFGYWTVSTNGAFETLHDENPVLSFLMESNTTVTATFLANMFLPAPSVYNGLFYPTNAEGTNAEATNAGPLGIIGGLTVGPLGGYSGRIVAWGFQTNQAITGVFRATNGFAGNSVTNGTNVISLEMTFRGSNIVGQVSDAEGTSQLLLKRTARTSANAAYTMLLLPLETNAAQGDGYAFVTNEAGAAVISGTLADGTPFSEAVGVSSDNDVPLYAALYARGGVVAGWLPLVGETNLLWIKPTTSSGLFPAGFTNYLMTRNALWKAMPAFSLPAGGTLTFTNGGLEAPLTLNFTLKNDLLYDVGNGYFGAVNPQNGRINLAITQGSAEGITSAKGILLRNPTNGSIEGGGGFFLISSNSGAMILTPN